MYVCFSFFGAVYFVIGYYAFRPIDVQLGYDWFVDGVAYVILGLLLFFLKSRIIAVLLLLIGVGTLISTFLNILPTIDPWEGDISSIFLVLGMVYVATAGVYLAFKYHGLR